MSSMKNTNPILNRQVLKQKQQDQRIAYTSEFNLRIHRAISWLKAADSVTDLDSVFIYNWIAFNAAYATTFEEAKRSEKQQQSKFFQLVIKHDKDAEISNAIWNEFPNAIRILLENKYVFEAFWGFQRGELSELQWTRRFKRSKTLALTALATRQTEKTLQIIFDRLYTIRNQLMHGGSTWNSSFNREQLRDGVKILKVLVPLIISVMMENHEENWGSVSYPPLD